MLIRVGGSEMAKPYDVFLSHNSQDKPAVERLTRQLTDTIAQFRRLLL